MRWVACRVSFPKQVPTRVGGERAPGPFSALRRRRARFHKGEGQPLSIMAGYPTGAQTVLICLALLGGTVVVWWQRSSPEAPALGDAVALRPGPARTAADVPSTGSNGPAVTVPSAAVASGSGDSARAGGVDAVALERILAEALENPVLDERRLLLRGLAEFTAKHAPELATHFLTAILRRGSGSADGDAYAFVQVFADVRALQDPRATARWGETVPDRLKDVVNQFVARHWTASDPEAASDWMRTVTDPALRATIIRAMSQQFTQADPAGFAPQWAADLARGPDGSRFSDIVVSFWARKDAPAAWEWVRRLENADDRAQAVLAFATVTGETAPEQTLAWVQSLSGGATSNRAVLETVSSWARRDPARAAAWVDAHAGIPGLVSGSAHAIVTSWFRSDRVSAARWLESAPIPAEMKQYFLAMAGQSGSPR